MTIDLGVCAWVVLPKRRFDKVWTYVQKHDMESSFCHHNIGPQYSTRSNHHSEEELFINLQSIRECIDDYESPDGDGDQSITKFYKGLLRILRRYVFKEKAINFDDFNMILLRVSA
jgi:hypothetical protein